jgi:hypothetical protein
METPARGASHGSGAAESEDRPTGESARAALPLLLRHFLNSCLDRCNTNPHICCPQAPPVTVVLPIRGCRPHSRANWDSQLHAHYGACPLAPWSNRPAVKLPVHTHKHTSTCTRRWPAPLCLCGGLPVGPSGGGGRGAAAAAAGGARTASWQLIIRIPRLERLRLATAPAAAAEREWGWEGGGRRQRRLGGPRRGVGPRHRLQPEDPQVSRAGLVDWQSP